MLKIMLKSVLVFLTLFNGVISQATEMSAEQKACSDAIQKAYDDIARERERQANITANSVTSASAGDQQTTSSGSPLADHVNRVALGNQKKAEVIKQQLEQERQLNTEQFKQVIDIEDKMREMEKEKSKLPTEKSNAYYEQRKQEAEIRMKCQERAQKEYDALIANNSSLSVKSQYTTNSLSQVRGTRSRMTSQRRVFFARCIKDPATLEAIQLTQDELNTKLYNFNIQAGIINADLEYTASKVPKLLAHMDEQRRYVAQAADIQMNTIDQQMQTDQMSLMYALFTSAENSNGQVQAAARFSSADDIMNNWESLRRGCANNQTKPFEVPADLIGIFHPVNTACRPSSAENPENACVRSTGKPSVKPVRNNSLVTS